MFRIAATFPAGSEQNGTRTVSAGADPSKAFEAGLGAGWDFHAIVEAQLGHA